MKRKNKDILDRDGVRRIVILSDIHYPYEDKKACAAVLKYVNAEHIDELIQVGDLLDINSISAHNLGKPKLVEGERLLKDYEYTNKRLDEWTQAARNKNSKAKIILLKGNHEHRVDRYIEEHPALEGLIDVHVGLNLKKRGIKYVESYPKGDLYRTGHVAVHHGLYCGSHHAKKHVDAFGTNVFYGHTHQVQAFSKVLWGRNKTLIGVSIGCLCRYDMPYLGGKPTAWQHAFAVIHMLPSGFFSWQVCSIFDGEFVGPTGKRYSWKSR